MSPHEFHLCIPPTANYISKNKRSLDGKDSFATHLLTEPWPTTPASWSTWIPVYTPYSYLHLKKKQVWVENYVLQLICWPDHDQLHLPPDPLLYSHAVGFHQANPAFESMDMYV